MKYAVSGCDKILWPLVALVLALLLWATLGCASTADECAAKCKCETSCGEVTEVSPVG